MDLKNLFSNNILLSVLIAVNTAGTLFGIYYYIPQLLSTEAFFWPLIPDSPTATLLFALSLALIYRNNFRKSKGLKNIIYSTAFIGNVKYGIWTLYVLIKFMPHFTSVNSTLMYSFLLLSHFGMFLQAFVILPYINHSKSILIAPLLYLFNDIIDYSFQIHTSLPEAQQVNSEIAFAAYSLSIISGLLIYFNKYHNLSDLSLLERY